MTDDPGPYVEVPNKEIRYDLGATIVSSIDASRPGTFIS